MARHQSFGFEFKRQVALDFLERRAELRGLTRDFNLPWRFIRLPIQKYKVGQFDEEAEDAVCNGQETLIFPNLLEA